MKHFRLDARPTRSDEHPVWRSAATFGERSHMHSYVERVVDLIEADANQIYDWEC